MPHLFPFQQNLHPSSPSHFRGTQASRGTQVRSFHCLSRAPGSSPVLESPALISEQDRRSVTTLLRAVSSWILIPSFCKQVSDHPPPPRTIPEGQKYSLDNFPATGLPFVEPENALS
ncbi:hypothetical protein B2J93_1336 [Marssonina coronariae]|uniref:Uncharacterized protein n=1 Tax=Diplocarpon coronariae TaxID=2795749 RepID=A0A218Z8T8_9HELO|nr:hypothetical protein B2J93_1336 [Marssonina coronariae]